MRARFFFFLWKTGNGHSEGLWFFFSSFVSISYLMIFRWLNVRSQNLQLCWCTNHVYKNHDEDFRNFVQWITRHRVSISYYHLSAGCLLNQLNITTFYFILGMECLRSSCHRLTDCILLNAENNLFSFFTIIQLKWNYDSYWNEWKHLLKFNVTNINPKSIKMVINLSISNNQSAWI